MRSSGCACNTTLSCSWCYAGGQPQQCSALTTAARCAATVESCRLPTARGGTHMIQHHTRQCCIITGADAGGLQHSVCMQVTLQVLLWRGDGNGSKPACGRSSMSGSCSGVLAAELVMFQPAGSAAPGIVLLGMHCHQNATAGCQQGVAMHCLLITERGCAASWTNSSRSGLWQPQTLA